MRGYSAKASAIRLVLLACGALALLVPSVHGQIQSVQPRVAAAKPATRPKLVVMLVVDQMRGDFVDKFRHQWSGGLKRLVEQGAWFHEAAYPYAATETCVGHSTISTGAFPATHGMIANDWWDRDEQKDVTCTADPKVKNSAYGGAAVKGGDSAARMLVPAFADELKYQSPAGARVLTFSLKARSAITLGGQSADAVTWFDGGSWVTSSAYPVASFVEEYAKAHPVSKDYGKTWAPSLERSKYTYAETAVGAVPPAGYGAAFPHPLRGAADSKGPDGAFYYQWATSPFADAYLAELGASAVETLGLGKGPSIDYLGLSFSSVDYVAHTFGPRSWEVQDQLAQLDRDLERLFTRLDKAVGRGNYVVALSGDHGGAPIPEDMQKAGGDAGWINLAAVSEQLEKVLEPFGFAKPAVANVGGSDVYFAPGVYKKLETDPAAMRAVMESLYRMPGVAHVFTAEELEGRPATRDYFRASESNSFLKARSGDLLILPKPFWEWDYSTAKSPRRYGTTHGTPYYYDQHVPILLMGWGIRHGEYFREVTPADIAPTLAALCGIALAPRDGHLLQEALEAGAETTSGSARRAAAPSAAKR
jgi:predicted AlkP superfamily pyrophosphatase or phosphodiesterase